MDEIQLPPSRSAAFEIRMRVILADLITRTAELRDLLAHVSEAADRGYLELEIDRLQATAHRILAFLDGVEGEPRN